jgi:hypothetical protein
VDININVLAGGGRGKSAGEHERNMIKVNCLHVGRGHKETHFKNARRLQEQGKDLCKHEEEVSLCLHQN